MKAIRQPAALRTIVRIGLCMYCKSPAASLQKQPGKVWHCMTCGKDFPEGYDPTNQTYKGRPIVKSYDPATFPYPPEPEDHS